MIKTLCSTFFPHHCFISTVLFFSSLHIKTKTESETQHKSNNQFFIAGYQCRGESLRFQMVILAITEISKFSAPDNAFLISSFLRGLLIIVPSAHDMRHHPFVDQTWKRSRLCVYNFQNFARREKHSITKDDKDSLYK